jgi:DNA-binding MarR family transcriptional regulator
MLTAGQLKKNWIYLLIKNMGKSPFDLKHQNENTDSRIIAAMERISQAYRVLLWNESKEFLLSPIQIQILIFLLFHSEEKRKVSYLADEFNMTKATISDSIKVLEQKKFIRKEYEQHDTRSYTIHLTTNGKEIAKQTAAFTNQIQEPITGLNSEDKENLLISLMSIIQHLNKTGVITIQRMCKTCVHFSPGKGKAPNFCKLLNQNLYDVDLRIDCPEHVLVMK